MSATSPPQEPLSPYFSAASTSCFSSRGGLQQQQQHDYSLPFRILSPRKASVSARSCSCERKSSKVLKPPSLRKIARPKLSKAEKEHTAVLESGVGPHLRLLREHLERRYEEVLAAAQRALDRGSEEGVLEALVREQGTRVKKLAKKRVGELWSEECSLEREAHLEQLSLALSVTEAELEASRTVALKESQLRHNEETRNSQARARLREQVE